VVEQNINLLSKYGYKNYKRTRTVFKIISGAKDPFKSNEKGQANNNSLHISDTENRKKEKEECTTLWNNNFTMNVAKITSKRGSSDFSFSE
jgi:hypothetical protein